VKHKRIVVVAFLVIGCLGLAVVAAGLPQEAEPAPVPEYRVGSGDLLAVAVLQVPELATEVRVSQQGVISLPLLGVVRVGGLTPTEIEEHLASKLRESYVRNPHVSVQVAEIQSHPVSVVGAVATPGVFQVRGPTPLLELLSLAGGVTEGAGDTVLVERPLGIVGPAEAEPVTEIGLARLLESGDPDANVIVQPGDVVKVPRAAVVYVVGEVRRPGAFPLSGRDRLTVLRAVALGEGLSDMADTSDAVLLRTTDAGEQTEIALRLDRIIEAEEPDPALQANDVLFVPRSGGKAAARATLDVLSRVFAFRPF
jgi:polysaccharide export outer membrane protein